jgi:hypothetical protein
VTPAEGKPSLTGRRCFPEGRLSYPGSLSSFLVVFMPSQETCEWVTWGKTQNQPVGGQVPTHEGPAYGSLLPLLAHPLSAPLAQASLGDDLPLAFGSFGSLGNNFYPGCPEPNTLPWVSLSVLSPVNLAQYILLPVSCSLLSPACLQLLGGTQSWWSEVLLGR